VKEVGGKRQRCGYVLNSLSSCFLHFRRDLEAQAQPSVLVAIVRPDDWIMAACAEAQQPETLSYVIPSGEEGPSVTWLREIVRPQLKRVVEFINSGSPQPSLVEALEAVFLIQELVGTHCR
jgi:hypothetical protein